MTPSPVILDVQHLTMRFGGLVAVNDLSFQAKRGEITAIIGPNGAGKTTVFNCITGFYQPTEGMIRAVHPDGKEFLLERLFDFRIAQLARVARTFQNIRLFPAMTVLENLLIAQHNELMVKSGYTLFGLFGLPVYRGQTFAVHAALQRRVTLKGGHFHRWLFLFDETIDELFAGPVAEAAKQRARSIAASMRQALAERHPTEMPAAPGVQHQAPQD